MRIALASSNARLAGGAEKYLDLLVPLLNRSGHRTALICEFDAPKDRRRIICVDDTSADHMPLWCVAGLGLETAIAELIRWRPDVIFSQALSDPVLESRLTTLAPAVCFVHDYHGTCISGEKTFKFPVTHPCTRPFGALCLAHFYPHRCGGLNPVTMWRNYHEQAARLEALRRYRKIVVASEHMRVEYLNNGFSPTAVRRIGLPVVSVDSRLPSRDDTATPHRVVFIGRMEYLKGGELLTDAIQLAAAALGRPLHLTFAGEGRDRLRWEQKARRACQRDPRLTIAFAGWLEQDALNNLLDRSDLLAVPSLWPEPFGLVGREAGSRGVPAAAFNVGGISEWLTDGLNGHLAPGDPPTAQGLCAAIASCLGDNQHHAQLRSGARAEAMRSSIENHLNDLMEVLTEVAHL